MPDETDTPAAPDARMRLLAAAEVEFAEKGFDGATIRDITRRAGVNIASISYYFGDKEHFYTETVKYSHACATSPDTFPLPPPGSSPVERLEGFIREMVKRMHAPTRATALKLVMREMTDPGKAADVVVREFIQPFAFALRGLLAELLPGVDPKTLLMIGFSVIGQCLFYRQNRRVAELIFGKDEVDSLDLAAVSDHVVRFTLAALGHAAPIGTNP